MKDIIPKEEFEEIISTNPSLHVDFILIKKMIDYKAKNFNQYTNYIVDFELKEKNNEPFLSVITQEKEDYLKSMIDDFDEQTTAEQFEQNYINRSAIIIKPQKPFLDWHNNLYPGEDLDTLEESNTYLISQEIMDIEDMETYLRKKFDKFFMMELEDWHLNEKEWPQRRNYKMFKQWFKVEFSSMIYDLEKSPVLKSE